MIEITYDVPLPAATQGAKSVYPFANMKPGASFWIPLDGKKAQARRTLLQGAASRWARAAKVEAKFTTAEETRDGVPGVRIWMRQLGDTVVEKPTKAEQSVAAKPAEEPLAFGSAAKPASIAERAQTAVNALVAAATPKVERAIESVNKQTKKPVDVNKALARELSQDAKRRMSVEDAPSAARIVRGSRY